MSGMRRSASWKTPTTAAAAAEDKWKMRW